MTKGELIDILEPFSNSIKIIMADGEDVVLAKYMISDDGEGIIVLSDRLEDEE